MKIKKVLWSTELFVPVVIIALIAIVSFQFELPISPQKPQKKYLSPEQRLDNLYIKLKEKKNSKWREKIYKN